MKPSERIKEIQVSKRTNLLGKQFTEYPLELAILEYLDEEYERNKKSCNCYCYCHQAKYGEIYTTVGCIHCKGYEVIS